MSVDFVLRGRERARCPWCERAVKVRVSGGLFRHATGERPGALCLGSGFPVEWVPGWVAQSVEGYSCG